MTLTAFQFQSLTNKTHTKHGQFRQSLRSTCPITNHVQYLQITNRDLPQHPKLTADICTISHKCISYQNHGLFCFNLCQAWNTITNKLLQFSSVTTALSKCHHWTPEKNVHSVSNKTSKWSTDSHWGKKKHTHTQTQTATPKCRYKQKSTKKPWTQQVPVLLVWISCYLSDSAVAWKVSFTSLSENNTDRLPLCKV